MIEREHVKDSIALGEHHDRGVRQAYVQFPISPQDESC